MFEKIKSVYSFLSAKPRQAHSFLNSPQGQRGEETASFAAITGLVLLIILVVMAIFRNALISTFNTIAGLLSF